MNTTTSIDGTLYQGIKTLPLEVITYKPLSSPRPTPLLFVHGAWHGAWCWAEHFLPFFSAKGYESHALNLRGHGLSPIKGTVRFARIADYVADVEEVAARMPAPPVLIGHSMGGFITQKYLERHDAPAGVLLTPPPPGGLLSAALRTARHDFHSFLQVNLQLNLYRAVDTLEKTRRVLFSADMPDDQVQEYFRKLGNDSYLAYLDMLLFALPDPKRIKTPLLVLGAADDHNFSTAEIEATARAYHAPYEIFPNMAHNMMLEKGWESVAARIATWLGEKGI
jgi:pimeloyl-ACP methyl ester carboxylesterase